MVTPSTQVVEIGLVDLAVGAHLVAAQPAGVGMGDDAGKPAVVGEEQQTLGVDVEPADRHHAGQILGQIVEDGRAALGVARRGHEPARLVVEPEARALLRWEAARRPR